MPFTGRYVGDGASVERVFVGFCLAGKQSVVADTGDTGVNRARILWFSESPTITTKKYLHDGRNFELSQDGPDQAFQSSTGPHYFGNRRRIIDRGLNGWNFRLVLALISWEIVLIVAV